MVQTAPILAIDTSTDAAGIALLGDGACVGLTWNAGRNQTTSILDHVDRCLTLAGVSVAGLSGIAVAVGPGMFTSLRVGISLVKGLAIGLDLPVIGVSTLEVTAGPWFGLDRDVVAVVAVGRDRVVWQRFTSNGIALAEPVNSAVDELREEVRRAAPVLVAGEVPDSLTPETLGNDIRVRGGNDGRRDPLRLARIGRDRLQRHGPDDLVRLQPTYVHSRSGSVAGV